MSKIYNKTGELMYSDDTLTLIQLVELYRKYLQCANLEDADLRYANLRFADLRFADLRYANLRFADLRFADLRFADLKDADLKDANLRGADLRFADLKDADLRGADLRGADLKDANLRGADLKGAKIDLKIEDGLLQKVAHAALASKTSLEMGMWHTCDTTHCIAGWSCHLAKNGKELENKYGTQIAGLLLLGVEAHGHFFDDNEEAREWLKTII